ncbi:MAG: hypothetical protein M0Z45_01550 [Actinomycetota bacterium]|nr:hypothetical protein [Actinomycetota bacterium]
MTSYIADRFTNLAFKHADIIRRSLDHLAWDFLTIDSIAPRRAGAFAGGTGNELDVLAANAHMSRSTI